MNETLPKNKTHSAFGSSGFASSARPIDEAIFKEQNRWRPRIRIEERGYW
jgi:hypothetical protein